LASLHRLLADAPTLFRLRISRRNRVEPAPHLCTDSGRPSLRVDLCAAVEYRTPNLLRMEQKENLDRSEGAVSVSTCHFSNRERVCLFDSCWDRIRGAW
jgi:hypothetical protein